MSSLAMLTSVLKTDNKDYIEIFLPFIATLIKKKNYTTVQTDILLSDFKEEFGFSIPFHPMQSILTRAKKKGIISKERGKFTPVNEKVCEYEFSSASKNQIRQHEKLISEINSYARDKHNYTITRERTENVLVSFLKKHDLDILFASEGMGLLPDAHSSKSDLFILCSFIKNAYDSEPEIFKYFLDVAIGNLMANFILFHEQNIFVGKLNGICFYLDTQIILRLLGIEGNHMFTVYDEFLKTLVKEGAYIKIFQHTYKEMLTILQDCVHRIDNSSYNPSRATDVLRYFVQKGYSKHDIMRFINKIDNILDSYSIKTVAVEETPTVQDRVKYQEDERKLRELIVKAYSKFRHFIASKREATLNNDIDSISSTFILRKGERATCLKDVRHVFVTSNAALASASSKYDRMVLKDFNSIPTCLTDTFVGTILWALSPAKLFGINQKKIIADCYAALQPSITFQ